MKLWSNDLFETKICCFFHPKKIRKKLGKICSSSANLTNFAKKKIGGRGNAPDFGCDKTENKTLLRSCEFIYSFIHSHHGALILASMGRGGGTGGGGVLGS